MDKPKISRRQFLTLTGLAAAGTAGACVPQKAPLPETMTAQSPSRSQSGKRVLRVAHLTDFHITAEKTAQEGMALAIRHAQSQPDPPDIILNTGDCVMDALEASKDRAEAQWAVFNKILKAEVRLPIFHAIGNHDVWGWGRPGNPDQSDPLYGKAMAVKQLGLSNRYYSFDKAGWHFIILDSTHAPNEVSKYPYIGQLDKEQFDWLVEDVEAVPASTPVCVATHIAILCAGEYFDGMNEESGNWVVPAAWMHIDARRLRQFFLQHPNIRVCLSGHSHEHETLDYLGVRYMNDGAVCGNWWNGSYLDFPPAYVLVDLYEDGRAESTFVPYQG